MKILYTDIDYVLSLGSELHPKMTKWGYVHRFNKKAVQIYNEILEKTGAEIIISSDWKNHFSLQQLQEIFIDYAGIIKAPIDVTPTIPGIILKKLEEWRAKEIMESVLNYKPDAWVAIDDLNLKPWIPENYFVHLPRFMEGIKQSSKKEEIINKLK
jgi:hypothetical protein